MDDFLDALAIVITAIGAGVIVLLCVVLIDYIVDTNFYALFLLFAPIFLWAVNRVKNW